MQLESEEIKQEKLTQELIFTGYPSIERYMQEKILKKIKKERCDADSILWVSSEKIHGCNFSIFCTREFVRYGRRNDFLTKEIPIECKNIDPDYFMESFHDVRNLVIKFHHKLQNIYQDIKKFYPTMARYVIYGEYFGGFWPEQSEKIRPIQKGVYYSPNFQFMAFDIKIYTPEKVFWVDVTDIPKLLKDNLMSIPIYAKGTFDEIYEIETKIDSTIPELLGLPKIQKNIIQGMVLRPNRSITLKSNQRVILKKKNVQFLETMKPNKEKKYIIDQKNPEYFFEQLQIYVNFNRIESVMSKFPDLKDRKKLKQEIKKDIMNDAIKDDYKGPQPDIKKKVQALFDFKVLKLLDEYFLKN